MNRGYTLTKIDLADKLHKNIGISRQDCGEIVDTVLDVVIEHLVKDGAVKIRSFGSFYVSKKRERMGRNPKTGVDIKIQPRKVASFRASNVLKNRVNASSDFNS